ncbi:cyclophilin-like fold protein [Pseudomonas syringae group sp. J309-1]|uniref:cyclophilin-like fold protein n=1 Tax=Pseudomonas syringae group sp. J309-1 TaxID=3079588 RepID=UPI00210CC5F1|nr:cyclophilin-like fold protein [Pseudomonas syringae group sp. J309-1]MCQ2995158.1 cyclophilin-like fold protein [Pseudomonas syringae]MDU8361199.1 cyclophilin-like fold protein [Pseudomonas syringae group sp. J309-1]
MTRLHRLRQSALRVMVGLMALGTQVISISAVAETTATSTRTNEQRISMTVGERRFTVTLADNETGRAFAARLPLTLDMPDLNDNEKHVTLSQQLPTAPFRPGVIRNGDLMLYGSNTLVLFYLTFDSPYSYTRIGRVEDADDLAQVLGRNSARVVFAAQ